MTEPTDAREALNAIYSARRNLPGNAQHAGTYNFLTAFITGLVVAGQGFPSPWSTIIPFVSFPTIIFLLFLGLRAQGWWISVYTAPGVRGIAFATLSILVALLCISVCGKNLGMMWVPFATGVAAFLIMNLSGGMMWRAWERELEKAAL